MAVSGRRDQRCPAMGASPWIVSDDLWERIEPLLPKRERRFRYPGRKPVPDRQVLCGILFVLHTASPCPSRPGNTNASSKPRASSANGPPGSSSLTCSSATRPAPRPRQGPSRHGVSRPSPAVPATARQAPANPPSSAAPPPHHPQPRRPEATAERPAPTTRCSPRRAGGRGDGLTPPQEAVALPKATSSEGRAHCGNFPCRLNRRDGPGRRRPALVRSQSRVRIGRACSAPCRPRPGGVAVSPTIVQAVLAPRHVAA